MRAGVFVHPTPRHVLTAPNTVSSIQPTARNFAPLLQNGRQLQLERDELSTQCNLRDLVPSDLRLHATPFKHPQGGQSAFRSIQAAQRYVQVSPEVHRQLTMQHRRSCCEQRVVEGTGRPVHPSFRDFYANPPLCQGVDSNFDDLERLLRYYDEVESLSLLGEIAWLDLFSLGFEPRPPATPSGTQFRSGHSFAITDGTECSGANGNRSAHLSASRPAVFR